MGSLNWMDDYSVGISSIDNEHKLMLSLINDAHRVIDTTQDFQIQMVSKILQQISRCILNHFESEERFLLFNNYPDYTAHKAEHGILLEKLHDFEERLLAEKQPFTEAMLLFLQDWLVRHIILHDLKYGLYFKGSEQIDHFG